MSKKWLEISAKNRRGAPMTIPVDNINCFYECEDSGNAYTMIVLHQPLDGDNFVRANETYEELKTKLKEAEE